jgi:hypothetical protein
LLASFVIEMARQSHPCANDPGKLPLLRSVSVGSLAAMAIGAVRMGVSGCGENAASSPTGGAGRDGASLVCLEQKLERDAPVVMSVVTPENRAAEIANDLSGAPGRTRTCDPRLRRPLLYPTELRARKCNRLQLQAFSV